MKQRVALLTGCSSGIGRALALELQRRDWLVFATARKVEALADLSGMEKLALDVTDSKSVDTAVNTVIQQAGHIDLLINNAGFGLMGPVSELPLTELRRQMDTNVLGALAVAQAVVPHMLRQHSGCIVNVGSVAGVLITPFAGAYGASKAALHALTDALRLELAPLGIAVVSLQPGGVISRFGDTASGLAAHVLKPDSAFSAIAGSIEARARTGQQGAMDATDFARRVVDSLVLAQPPAILRIGTHSTRLPLLRWLLPARLTDRILRRKFGLDRLGTTP